MSLLRRSSFKRPQYERPPRAPLVPIVGCRGTYASSGTTAAPKEIILRSRAYLMWVATHPCALCGWPETQAAHENLGKALQGKVCDSRTFALCVPHGAHIGHHVMFDQYIDVTRDQARELGAKLSAQMRERAIVAGWRFTAERIVAP